jgi:ubiquinone/menaquinone biosynthesis C-methylase UbiE
MKISKNYDRNYWDGDRKFGYGGYRYIINYFTPLAKKIIKNYKLSNNSKILDLGCGKGFLIYEIKKILPKIKIIGMDISKYAKINAKKEVKKFIINYDLRKKLKFENAEFDLVISVNTLHNLKLEDLERCLSEIERVGKEKFICVESYRNIKEQFNLQCWALTAETIIHKSSWLWLFNKVGYSGDYEFIYFE